MSWLARSLATSLNLPDDSGADDDPDTDAAASPTPIPSPSARIPPPPPPMPPHLPHSAAAEGVKEDLTELSKTLTRQYETGQEAARHDAPEADEEWHQWVERVRLGVEDDRDSYFSMAIAAMRFDFDMSDAQQEHALAIEQLAPRLAALRIELCPIHMSDECFWKIYFVLLHPRLNKHDAELLSTPQCLQNQSKLETEQLGHRKDDLGVQLREDTFREASPFVRQEVASVMPITEIEIEKHPIQVTEVPVVDKSVIKEELPKNHTETSNILQDTFDDDVDDWFDEEADLAGHPTIHIGDEEDVSFSDLEEDDVK
nr:unnamed protein product [Digitaria exilis]